MIVIEKKKRKRAKQRNQQLVILVVFVEDMLKLRRLQSQNRYNSV